MQHPLCSGATTVELLLWLEILLKQVTRDKNFFPAYHPGIVGPRKFFLGNDEKRLRRKFFYQPKFLVISTVYVLAATTNFPLYYSRRREEFEGGGPPGFSLPLIRQPYFITVIIRMA